MSSIGDRSAYAAVAISVVASAIANTFVRLIGFCLLCRLCSPDRALLGSNALRPADRVSVASGVPNANRTESLRGRSRGRGAGSSAKPWGSRRNRARGRTRAFHFETWFHCETSDPRLATRASRFHDGLAWHAI